MSDPLGIRRAARRVTERTTEIEIQDSAIRGLSKKLSKAPMPEWDAAVHFFDGTEKTINWLIALDAANFSFWPDPGNERWRVEHGGEWLDGYQALAASFKRAVGENVPLHEPKFLASLTAEQLRGVFRGKGEIPLFAERLANLREAGSVLIEKFGGSGAALVERAGGSAAKLAALVVEAFPSFRDEARYYGESVPFHKRAQILAADIHGAFESGTSAGKSPAAFHDMDSLTAFADYKVPQILRELGVLVYSPSLARHIDERLPIEAGGRREVEIRAATVEAVERLSAGSGIPPFRLDGALWRMSQTLSPDRNKPYHLTRTIYY